MTDKKNVIPATPITPLPVPPVGMPRVPVTLFNVWTWNSPVIPQFYWNVYSAEQRIKEICKQIGKIAAYLDYAATTINEANVDMIEQINKINSDLSEQISELTEELTSEVTRLDDLITAEAEAREAADTALRNDLDAETQARTAADSKLTTDLQAETAAREDADETLHTELSAETTARTHADDQLHTEISTETQARQNEDTEIKASVTQEIADRKAADDALGKRIDAADAANAQVAEDLSDEVDAREAADTALQGKLDAETSAREAADADLQSKITAEVTARGEAISALTTRVATEESTRQAEDAKLGARIDATNANVQNNASAIITETQAREAADTAINESLATKLVRDDLRSSGKITLTPGEGNTLTIGDTFEADFDALQSAISGLQSALESETSERRHDDSQLQTAVDARLERGKLLAGEGIEVQNDPDQSTVTVSAKVTETELSAVEEKADAAKETADAASTMAGSALISATAAQTTAEGKLSTVSVGDGLTGDGTTGSPLTLTPATSDWIGGVKVGDGLVMSLNGKLSVDPFAEVLAVSHDDTLSGSGSPFDQLGVNYGEGLTVRGGKLTAAPATTSTIGGIKVGEGLTVTADGTLSASQGGSGLAEVAHDVTLSGDGTTGSPLGVNYGSGLTMSGGKLAAQVTKADLTAVTGKADAAQRAADEAAAAVAGKAGPLIKTLLFSSTITDAGRSGSADISRPEQVPVGYEPIELRMKLNDQATTPSTGSNFESYIGEKANGAWWGHYSFSGFEDQTAVSVYVIWGPVTA